MFPSLNIELLHTKQQYSSADNRYLDLCLFAFIKIYK